MNAENLKQKVILFIDDEKICHTLAELIIPNYTDYKLVGAYNGEEALMLAERYSKDLILVLSDILLPDINGYEIFNKMRKDDRFASTPFLFQSGLDLQEKKLREHINEDIKIIHKPYKQDVLLEAIESAIL